MAESSIAIEGDLSALLEKMRGIAAMDRAGLTATLGEAARDSTVERFKTGKSPEGKKWKTSKRAAETGGTTLVKSAQLRSSINVESDDTGFAVGTNAIHAATHQFGASGRVIKARRKKALHFQVDGQWITKKQVTVNIPARPFLGFSDEDIDEFEATIDEFMEGIM